MAFPKERNALKSTVHFHLETKENKSLKKYRTGYCKREQPVTVKFNLKVAKLKVCEKPNNTIVCRILGVALSTDL